MEFPKLLLLLVELFLSTATLLSHHKVTISVILDTPLLDGIDLNVLAPQVILRLRNLPLQILDHLLARLQHLLFRIVIRMGSMKLCLLLLELELHFLNVILHALGLESIAFKF